MLAIIGGALGNFNSTNHDNSSASQGANTSQNQKQESDNSKSSIPATESEKAELASEIEKAKAIDVNEYTSDTISKLTSAIKTGEKVYDNEKATSSEVKIAISGITLAISQLKEIEKPVVLSGYGDDIVDIPSYLSTCLVDAQYTGGSNFVIRTLDKSGSSIDLLVNTIGAYSGTTTTGMRSGTPAFLEIKASGPWTITLKPITDAEVISSGQPMHGDNVVGAITSSATKLKITNSGKSNFVVYGFSSSGSKLLVNEIGDYSGTVVNKGYSLFVVKSEGDWSISW